MSPSLAGPTIAVVGTRTIGDAASYALLCATLDALRPGKIVSGGATGADFLAVRYAKSRMIPLVEHKPDWQKHQKAAGAIRNRIIVAESDLVVALWDGKSPGTAITIEEAKKAGKQVIIIGPGAGKEQEKPA